MCRAPQGLSLCGGQIHVDVGFLPRAHSREVVRAPGQRDPSIPCPTQASPRQVSSGPTLCISRRCPGVLPPSAVPMEETPSLGLCPLTLGHMGTHATGMGSPLWTKLLPSLGGSSVFESCTAAHTVRNPEHRCISVKFG